MRIHLVTDQFSVGGGIEHISQIVRGLKEFHFGIFGKPGPAVDKFQDLDNVRIYDQGFKPSYVLQDSPDLIHIHHLKPLVTFFRNPFKHYDIPLMFTAHGLHIHKFEFYNTFTARLKYVLRFGLEKTILPKVRKVLAVSREDKEFMENRYRLKNVDYLTNGIDAEAVNASQKFSKEELLANIGIPPGTFVFVTVARFNFQKGYDFLIESISSIKGQLELIEKNHRPCRFLLVGDGPEMDSVQEMAKRLSVSRYVRFLGARRDVYDLINAADIFLLPSRWEGLPIVLLEAGLLRTPVLASDTYGNREIIGDSNGILFENLSPNILAEYILKALEGQFNLEMYAQNLFDEVHRNYSLESMLTGLRERYKNLMPSD